MLTSSGLTRENPHLEIHCRIFVRHLKYQVTEQSVLTQLVHEVKGSGRVALDGVVQITMAFHGGHHDG